jgi:hypothetical protein
MLPSLKAFKETLGMKRAFNFEGYVLNSHKWDHTEPWCKRTSMLFMGNNLTVNLAIEKTFVHTENQCINNVVQVSFSSGGADLDSVW